MKSKNPADVLGDSGERHKMMRAQLRGARQADSECRAKQTTKAPADVVDVALGERQKMMRAQ